MINLSMHRKKTKIWEEKLLVVMQLPAAKNSYLKGHNRHGHMMCINGKELLEWKVLLVW